MQPDTIVNLVAGGALAAFLAKLLQQQYEARIRDFKERISEQSILLEKLTAGLDALGERIDGLELRQVARRAEHPGKGE